MKNQTVILILGIFIPSLAALVVLALHGVVPGTAVTTAVVGAMMGALGLAEPGSAAALAKSVLAGGVPSALAAIEKEIPK